MTYLRKLVLLAIALVIGAAIYLYIVGDPKTWAALAPVDDLPQIVSLSAIAIVLTISVILTRPKLREVGKAVLGWGGLALVLVTLYAFRHEAEQVGARVLGVLAPGVAFEQPGGSIEIIRDNSRHFNVSVEIDGVRVRMLVDTGASAVTLRAEDAAAAGFDSADLAYTTPVSTANGVTMVAPIRIARLRLGSIQMENIRAFAARPGALERSLLGLSALDKLSGWSVQGDRLILRP